MATASHIQLSTTQHPEYFRGGTSQDSVETASKLLQKNHDDFHIFFNRKAHHIITIWALGASPDQLEEAYTNHASYQRPMGEPDKTIVKDMQDPLTFKEHLNQEQHYTDYLALFQSEIEATSWQDVVNKYLLARDERANDLLCRFFAGFLHPIIHTGFGIETQQPAIVAEGLAMAAVSSGYMSSYFPPIEVLRQKNKDQSSKTVVDLLDTIQQDEELRTAPHWDDDNKLRDGIIARAGDKMATIASQFRVEPGELERKTAEMTNAAVYYTAGAQRETHERKYDFYYMHCVNCTIFYSAFLKADWLSEANKIRLLEYKVWNDLAMYASRKSPAIRMDLVRQYQPKVPSGWGGIIDRVNSMVDDDGHASKLIRALAHGQEICKPYEDRPEFRVKQNDWLQMGHMAIDSTENKNPTWVRSAGFDEAWEKIPLLKAQL